ncbi:MAG: hypothetical protein ABSG35_18370 [Syntrophobacteraceae bacterium]|jgi:hypothetical protein
MQISANLTSVFLCGAGLMGGISVRLIPTLFPKAPRWILTTAFYSGFCLCFFFIGAAVYVAIGPEEGQLLRTRQMLALTIMVICVVVFIFSMRWFISEKPLRSNAELKPAPLEVFPDSRIVKYGPGSKFHGIEWLPRYSELSVDINNPTSTDYDNFDAQISTDLVINHMVQIGGLGECKVEGAHGFTEPPHWQHMDGDQPVGPVDDPQWGYEVIPIDENGDPILPFLGADWTYRIRCSKIPANSHLVLFGALVAVNEHVYDKPPHPAPSPWPFFDPPRPAKWVTLVAIFQVSGHDYKKAIHKGSIGQIHKIE